MILRMMVIALMVMVTGCVSSTPLMKHERYYERTISLDGMHRDQLFDLSREWLKRNVAEEATVVHADRTKWTLECAGRMARPLSTANLTGVGDLTYLARETVYEDALTISFELQSVVVPRTYSTATYFTQGGTFSVVQADLAGARKCFDLLVNSLRTYLLTSSADGPK